MAEGETLMTEMRVTTPMPADARRERVRVKDGLMGPTAQAPGRVGVIVANTGSPDNPSPAAVRRYLAQFLFNERIAPMNRFSWWLILHLFVLPLRGRSSGRKYETIWDGTEFAFICDHRRIAEALEERYRDAGVDAKVEIAMSFGNPSIEHAMRSLADAGCGRLVVLPLYPQNAYSQAQIVADEVARCAEATGWDGRYCVIGDYSENDAYLDTVAESIKGSGYDPSKDWLLMSFHSIPRSDVERGDTYERNVWRTCHAIARRLGARRGWWAGGFQSRFDREREWVSPFSDDILSEWARKDIDGRLFVVCPNFAVDCLETYYDIDNVMRNRWSALQDGRDRRVPFVYVPCLGASDAHIRVLEAVIDAGRHVPAMDGPSKLAST